MESEAQLVPDLAHDRLISLGGRNLDGGANQGKEDDYLQTSHASVLTRPDEIVKLIEEASDAIAA